MLGMRSEVVVIGAGAAGLFSTIYLSKMGYSVTVLFKGFGATAMSSGCFDILGYSYKTKSYVSTYRKAFKSLPLTHPYKIISWDNVDKLTSIFNDSVNMASDVFKGFLEGDFRKNMLVGTLFGTVKPTAFVQKTMKGAILKNGLKFAIVGIENVYDFHPQLVKKMLEVYLNIFGFDDIQIDTYVIKRKEITDSLYKSYIPYLSLMVDRERYANSILKLSKRIKSDVILIPPIINDWQYVMEFIEKGDIIISEAPSPPLYKAGLRLNNYLINESKRLGARFIHVDYVKVYEKNGSPIVEFITNSRNIEIKTNAVVLATGDLIGGGIKAKRFFGEDYLQFTDPVINATIDAINGQELKMSGYFSLEKNPLTKIGYKVDENLRIKAKKVVPPKNVYLAGSIIGGYDYNFEKSGLGVALATAYIAVKNIKKVI